MTRDATTALLLGLSRGRLDESAQVELTGLLAQPIEWDMLAELAALHGVVGLVRRNLAILGAPDSVPAGAWQRIQDSANQTAFDGVLQLRETDSMAAVLNGAGIVPIVLKGHALADLLYDDPLVRPSVDIDLLVARSELARAEQSLAAIGYLPLSDSKRIQQLEQGYHVSLYREAMAGLVVLLELHWDLGARDLFRYDLDAWRGDAETFSLDGMSATLRRFKPEQQLLHLALHMRKHRYVGLRWLADVAELLRRFGGELDWRSIDASARRAGLQTLLFVSVTLANQYLGAPCPDEWLQRWTPSSARRRLLESVLTQDALLTPVEMEDAGWTRLAPAEVLLLDKPSAMARELRYRLFPPAEKLSDTAAGDASSAQRLSLYTSRLAQRTATLLRRSQ